MQQNKYRLLNNFSFKYYNNYKMYRFLTLILITITIASCGSKDNNDEIKLSSLIQPNFTFTYDLIECELNENSSLLDLEFFFVEIYIQSHTIISESKILQRRHIYINFWWV